MRTPELTRLATIKAEIRRHLPRTTPDSGAIFRCAQLFCEVDDEGLYELDREPNSDSWMGTEFKIGQRRRSKFLRIGRRLTKEETEGKTQALYDIAAGDAPDWAATRVRRLIKRNVPGLRDPDPDTRGLLALRLLNYLPNGEMRLRALACMRKVPPAVQAAAAAQVKLDIEPGAPNPPPL